jgi:hypothetical protein
MKTPIHTRMQRLSHLTAGRRVRAAEPVWWRLRGTELLLYRRRGRLPLLIVEAFNGRVIAMSAAVWGGSINSMRIRSWPLNTPEAWMI